MMVRQLTVQKTAHRKPRKRDMLAITRSIGRKTRLVISDIIKEIS